MSDCNHDDMPEMPEPTEHDVWDQLYRERDYERARADSLTASITAACEGTGCVNAHELAEALREERATSESRRKAWCLLRSALLAIAWTKYDNVAFPQRTAQDAMAIGCPIANGRADKAATDALAEALRDTRAKLAVTEREIESYQQLIADHCADEEKVRAILAEFDKSDTHGSDGPIELAERAAEALKQARADRDVLAYEVRKWRTTDKENGDWLAIGMGCCMDTDVSGALSRANGGGE